MEFNVRRLEGVPINCRSLQRTGGLNRRPGFSRTLSQLSSPKRRKEMSHIRVWLHFVWSTKNREPLLTEDIRKKVLSHIKENASNKSIFVDFINGWVDHIHCLVSLGPDQTIEKIAQLLKGESSFWINRNRLCPGKFRWQDDYFVVSVSESLVESVRNYIRNQEVHHRTRTFDDEYEDFLIRAGFQKVPDSGGKFG